MSIHGRNVVLTTYHNVGMMHWAVLFWGWLQMAGINRFLLLDLDGFSCGASKALMQMHGSTIHLECAFAQDMDMGSSFYSGMKRTSGLQEWGAPVP